MYTNTISRKTITITSDKSSTLLKCMPFNFGFILLCGACVIGIEKFLSSIFIDNIVVTNDFRVTFGFGAFFIAMRIVNNNVEMRYDNLSRTSAEHRESKVL